VSESDDLDLGIPILLHSFQLLRGCHLITTAIEDPNSLLAEGSVELRVVLQEIPLLEDAVLIMIRVSRSLESF